MTANSLSGESYTQNLLCVTLPSAPGLPALSGDSATGRMLFSGDDVKKEVGVLSGGEKVRCLLSMVMLQEANVLVLDEPTSHLDMESIEALQEALEEFIGTLIVVSHDREFIDSVATRVIVMEDNDNGSPKLTDWKGNYRDFREAHELE